MTAQRADDAPNLGHQPTRIPADEREDSDTTPVAASPFKRHGQHISLATSLRMVQHKTWAHWYPELFAAPLSVGEGSETFGIDQRKKATEPAYKQLLELMPDALALEPHDKREVCFVVEWDWEIDRKGKTTRTRIATHIATPPDDWRLWPSAMARLAADCDASNEVACGLYGTRLERAPESRDEAKTVVAARVAVLPKPGQEHQIRPKLSETFTTPPVGAPDLSSNLVWQQKPVERGMFFQDWDILADEFGVPKNDKDREDKRHALLTIITGDEHLSSWTGDRAPLITRMSEELLKEKQMADQTAAPAKTADEILMDQMREKYQTAFDRAMFKGDFKRAVGYESIEAARKGTLTDKAMLTLVDEDIARISDSFKETPADKKIDEKAPSSVETKTAAVVEPEKPASPVQSNVSSVDNGKPVETVDAEFVDVPQRPAPQMALVPNTGIAMLPMVAQWEIMRQQADVLIKSGFMPQSVRTPEQAITIMMMGSALQIDPIVALNGINVIQGKPTVSPQLMLALVRRSGQLESFEVTDDGQSCTVKMKRRGEPLHTERFSQSDASAMGLVGKDNWKKQPAVMRKWRAISAACRVVFPDVTWGIASYTTEEINPDVAFDPAA